MFTPQELAKESIQVEYLVSVADSGANVIKEGDRWVLLPDLENKLFRGVRGTLLACTPAHWPHPRPRGTEADQSWAAAYAESGIFRCVRGTLLYVHPHPHTDHT